MPSTVQKNYRINPLGATKTLVQAGYVVLVGWNLYTNTSADAYLKLFNAAATTDVTLGSTTPNRSLFIPGGGTVFLSNEDKFQMEFNKGLVIAVTTGGLDTDTGNPATGAMVELLYNSNVAN